MRHPEPTVSAAFEREQLSFHEVLFPETISYGSSGGPRFKTAIFSADSGFEQRNVNWQQVRCEFEVGHTIKDSSAMDTLRAFFMARRGRAYGFRYKDWGDYKLTQQVIGVGDGQNDYQIVKTYRSYQADSGSDTTFTRPLRKIAWGTIAGVTVGGVVVPSSEYTVDHDTGIISFDDPVYPGEEIKIGYGEFHVPCRFETDHLDVTQEFWNTESWPTIPIWEIRDWGEAVFSE